MAFVAAGSSLLLDSGSGLATVAEVESIGGPDIKVADVDVTNQLSANVAKAYLAGWIEAGEVPIEANFTAAQYTTLLGIVRQVKVWRILLSNGSHFDFSGYWNSLKIDVPLEAEIKMPFSIRITGLPTFTA